jgi:hypothetical protein
LPSSSTSNWTGPRLDATTSSAIGQIPPFGVARNPYALDASWHS